MVPQISTLAKLCKSCRLATPLPFLVLQTCYSDVPIRMISPGLLNVDLYLSPPSIQLLNKYLHANHHAKHTEDTTASKRQNRHPFGEQAINQNKVRDGCAVRRARRPGKHNKAGERGREGAAISRQCAVPGRLFTRASLMLRTHGAGHGHLLGKEGPNRSICVASRLRLPLPARPGWLHHPLP